MKKRRSLCFLKSFKCICRRCNRKFQQFKWYYSTDIRCSKSKNFLNPNPRVSNIIVTQSGNYTFTLKTHPWSDLYDTSNSSYTEENKENYNFNVDILAECEAFSRDMSHKHDDICDTLGILIQEALGKTTVSLLDFFM